MIPVITNYRFATGSLISKQEGQIWRSIFSPIYKFRNMKNDETLTLIKPSFLVHLSTKGGYKVPYGLFWLLHPYFWVQWSNYGLISNLESLYTHRIFEQHPMNHIFSVSWCQSDLVWFQNFWVFGMSIFEKLQFYTTWTIWTSNES